MYLVAYPSTSNTNNSLQSVEIQHIGDRVEHGRLARRQADQMACAFRGRHRSRVEGDRMASSHTRPVRQPTGSMRYRFQDPRRKHLNIVKSWVEGSLRSISTYPIQKIYIYELLCKIEDKLCQGYRKERKVNDEKVRKTQ